MYLEYTKVKVISKQKEEMNSLYAHTNSTHHKHHVTKTSQLSQKQYIFIVSYIVIKIVYR